METVSSYNNCRTSYVDTTHFKGVTYMAYGCIDSEATYISRWDDSHGYFLPLQQITTPEDTKPTFFNAGGTLFLWATVANNTGCAIHRFDESANVIGHFVEHDHDPIVGWQMYWFERDGEVYLYLPQSVNLTVPAHPPNTARFVTRSPLYKWV